jgi:hypothetical protein
MNMKRTLEPDTAAAEHVVSFDDLISDIHELLMTSYLPSTPAYFLGRTCRKYDLLYRSLVAEKKTIQSDRYFPKLGESFPLVHPIPFIADGYADIVKLWRLSEPISPRDLCCFDTMSTDFFDHAIWIWLNTGYPSTLELTSLIGTTTVRNFAYLLCLREYRDKRESLERGSDEITRKAIQGNNVELVEYLFERYPRASWDMDDLKCAAVHSYDIMILLFRLDPGIPSWLPDMLHDTSDIRLVELAHRLGLKFTSKLSLSAVKTGSPEILKFALTHGCVDKTQQRELFEAAVRLDDSACLQMLLDHGWQWQPLGTLGDDFQVSENAMVLLLERNLVPFSSAKRLSIYMRDVSSAESLLQPSLISQT